VIDDLVESITEIYNQDYPKFGRREDFLSIKLDSSEKVSIRLAHLEKSAVMADIRYMTMSISWQKNFSRSYIKI
jgi:hypothetical protein